MSSRAVTWRLVALLWLCALWLLLMLLSCVTALAHATLLQETPAAGTRQDKPPEEVRLQFNEPVDAEFDPLKVYDAEGNRVDEDDARIDPNDARVLIEGLKELPKGSYKVEWRVITSLDGHVVSGEYGFSVTGSGEGFQNGAKNNNQPAASNSEGIFDVFPRTAIYGVLSVCTLALVGLLGLLVTKLARRRHKA